jgi:hypothetical protein
MAIVKLGGGTIQVRYITHLTGEKDKIIRRNVKGVTVMHLSDVKLVDNFFTDKGIIDLSRCRIFHEDIGWMVLQEPYDEMVHLKMDGTIRVTGFKQRFYGRVSKPKVKKCKTKPKNNVKRKSSNRGNPRKNA